MTSHRLPYPVPQASHLASLLPSLICCLFLAVALASCAGDERPAEETTAAQEVDPADAPPEDIPPDELLREIEGGERAEEAGTAGGEAGSEAVAAPIEEAEIFLVELEAGGEGSFGCGDRLRGVRVPVPDVADEGVPGNVAAAVRALLEADGGAGLYDALARSELEVEAVEEVLAEEGIYRVRLVGELRPGGVCDHPRIAAQLRATAEAVEGVEEAEVWVGGRPVEQVLAQRH